MPVTFSDGADDVSRCTAIRCIRKGAERERKGRVFHAKIQRRNTGAKGLTRERKPCLFRITGATKELAFKHFSKNLPPSAVCAYALSPFGRISLPCLVW